MLNNNKKKKRKVFRVRQQRRVSSLLSLPHSPICYTSRPFPLLHPSRPLLKYVFVLLTTGPPRSRKYLPSSSTTLSSLVPKHHRRRCWTQECHSRLSLIEPRSLWCHSCCYGCRRCHPEPHCLPPPRQKGTVLAERRKILSTH